MLPGLHNGPLLTGAVECTKTLAFTVQKTIQRQSKKQSGKTIYKTHIEAHLKSHLKAQLKFRLKAYLKTPKRLNWTLEQVCQAIFHLLLPFTALIGIETVKAQLSHTSCKL